MVCAYPYKMPGWVSTRNVLFDAFYTTKSGGMGIDLSVSRTIVESRRGLLSAVPNEGPGATFFILYSLQTRKRERRPQSRRHLDPCCD